MIISDLNHLEVQEAEVVGGSGYPLKTTYDKYITVGESYYLKDYKAIGVVADIWGNVATANGAAEAYGYDTDAQAYSVTLTTDKSSSALASSISATSHNYYLPAHYPSNY